MNIEKILIENKIEFVDINDYLIIECPFCEKYYDRPTATLNLDIDTGDGYCSVCKISFKWKEIADKLNIKLFIQPLRNKEEKKDWKSKSKKLAEEPLPTEIDQPAERIKKLKPEKEIDYEEWKNVIQSNFPELLFTAEICLSVIAQILIKDITNPFALVLVDVPSAGKTIVVNFFADIKELTYATDKFTPASFISNATNVPKSQLKDIDLLPKLQYKMFLIRDLATIFSKKDDDLNGCLGTLTRVLDGEGLSSDTGVHGRREYDGEYLFMLLAASTPIPKKVWNAMGNLGSRLFFLSLNSKDKGEDELAMQLTTTTYKEKEKICRKTTTEFLKTLWSKNLDGVIWNKNENQNEKILIARCAKLLARLRGVIQVWEVNEFKNEGSYNHTTAMVEKPDRINQLFYNQCRGHALVRGRTHINDSDLKRIIELSIDSAPTFRAKLFRKLIEYGGNMKTGQVEAELKCSKPTALKEMETLKILGVCDIKQDSYGEVGEPEKEICLVEDFLWFISKECKRIRDED